MAEPEIRYCTTADGVNIAYYTMGEGLPLVVTCTVIWSHLGCSIPRVSPQRQRRDSGAACSCPLRRAGHGVIRPGRSRLRHGRAVGSTSTRWSSA